jgi:hypothetical protein
LTAKGVRQSGGDRHVNGSRPHHVAGDFEGDPEQFERKRKRRELPKQRDERNKSDQAEEEVEHLRQQRLHELATIFRNTLVGIVNAGSTQRRLQKPVGLGRQPPVQHRIRQPPSPPDLQVLTRKRPDQIQGCRRSDQPRENADLGYGRGCIEALQRVVEISTPLDQPQADLNAGDLTPDDEGKHGKARPAAGPAGCNTEQSPDGAQSMTHAIRSTFQGLNWMGHHPVQAIRADGASECVVGADLEGSARRGPQLEWI